MAKRKRQTPGKLNGDRRRHLVAMVTDIIRTGRPTPFAFEAACRHGLRIQFIFEGWPWQPADDAAAEIVATALRMIGAKRPTWLQGQREYTVGREDCSWCAMPLDPVDVSHGRRFCSADCARAARIYRDYDAGGFRNDALASQAGYILKLDQSKPRDCARCGTPFTSLDRAARFCSIKCKGAALRVLADRECANPRCGKVYRPRRASFKYCCHECSIEGRGAVLDARACRQCGKSFQPRNEYALLCSPKCLQRSKDARQRAKRQARLLPKPCERCGESYQPNRNDQRFCSSGCQKHASDRRRHAASAFMCEAAE